MSKKRYFKDKLKGVQKMIWDFEFKRFKTDELYEEIREERDNQKSKLSVLLARIESEKANPTMESGEIARLDDDKVRLEKSIENLESQMNAINLELHGSKKCVEYPDGLSGVDQTIDSLYELVGMMKSYIKKI